MLGNPVSCRGHNHITYKYRLKGDSFIFIKLTQTSNSSADSLLRFVVLGLVFFQGCFKLPADRQTVMFNVDALQSWMFGTTCSYGLCIELSAHQWDSVGMFQIPENSKRRENTRGYDPAVKRQLCWHGLSKLSFTALILYWLLDGVLRTSVII